MASVTAIATSPHAEMLGMLTATGADVTSMVRVSDPESPESSVTVTVTVN